MDLERIYSYFFGAWERSSKLSGFSVPPEAKQGMFDL